MKATEQIEAIKGMATLKEIQAVLDTEKKAKKPRKSVIDACEERIGEITTGATDKPAEESVEKTAPAEKTAAKTDKKAEKEDLTERIKLFESKIQRNVRVHNVAPFAKEFFGDLFQKSSVKGFTVTITLTSGDTIKVDAK